MPKASPLRAGKNGEPSPAHAEIGRRAYEIFLERGSVHGHDLDDWLRAEHLKKRLLIFPSVISIVVGSTTLSVNDRLEKGSQRLPSDSVI